MLTATHILGFRGWGVRLRVMLGLLLWGWGAGAWGEPIQAISRPTRNTWVVDVTGTLAHRTLVEVDRLGLEVERSGQGQLVVAVVNTTEGRPPRAFATELFNRWGIGHTRRDDGALLFVALRDRKAEIILGDGVDTPEDVARSRALMQESIVPAFQRGDVNAAVLAGARGLQALLASAPLNQGLVGQPLALPERPVATQPSKQPVSKKTSQPAREPKEFLDDEGMYVELSTSGSSGGEGESAEASGTVAEPRLPSSVSGSRREGTPGTSLQTSVSPWAWVVVAGFFVLLIVGNLLRRRRCGHEGTSTRMTSSRGHSHSHSHGDSHGRSHGGSLGGGRSSGGGSSGSW